MTRPLLSLLLALPAGLCLAGTEGPAPAQDPAAWRRECGACHVLYPPHMLPAAAWRRMMGGLERHFGSDASLDGPARRAITRWLVSRAGPAGRGRTTLRITETAAFRHEHQEIALTVWQRPAVGSPANCQACHRDAERGRFDESALRIPR